MCVSSSRAFVSAEKVLLSRCNTSSSALQMERTNNIPVTSVSVDRSDLTLPVQILWGPSSPLGHLFLTWMGPAGGWSGGGEGEWKRKKEEREKEEEEKERKTKGRRWNLKFCRLRSRCWTPTASFSSSVNFFPKASPTALCREETKLHTLD